MQNIVYVITKIDWSDPSNFYKPIWKICRTLRIAMDIVDADLINEGYIIKSFNIGLTEENKYQCHKFKPFEGYSDIGLNVSYSVSEMKIIQS